VCGVLVFVVTLLFELVADVFGGLWDYGVSEGSKSVHPVGNPMSHSTHVGFKCPPFVAVIPCARIAVVARSSVPLRSL